MRKFWQTSRERKNKADWGAYLRILPIRVVTEANLNFFDWTRENIELKIIRELLMLAQSEDIDFDGGFVERDPQVLKPLIDKYAKEAMDCKEAYPTTFSVVILGDKETYKPYKRWELIEELIEDGFRTRGITTRLTKLDKQLPSSEPLQQRTK